LKKAVLLGDGGIYDNLGTEAMTQRLVKVLKNSSYRGALLIVVNAEAPYQFGEGFRMVSVIHKLAETRARVLSRVLMDRLAAALPKQKKIHVVEIPLKKGGSSLKESKTIWKIPTAFKISKDHRKLVGKAVKRLMKARRPRIRSIAKELLRSESARQGAPKTSVSPEAREGSGGGGKAPPSVRPSPTPKVPAAGTFHGDPGDPASPRAPASPGAPDPNTSSGTRPRTPAPR